MTYLSAYLTALAAALGLVPLLGGLAGRWGMVDAPGLRKVHSRAVPRVGGVGVFAAAAAALALVFAAGGRGAQSLWGLEPSMLAALAGTAVMFAVGLVDDARGLRARTKLLAQTLAGCLIFAGGLRFGSLSIAGWFSWDLGWLSLPATLLWVMGVTNAVNLIDGLDGLSGGIALVACGAVAALSAWMGRYGVSLVSLAAMGSLTGFLVFNIHPARVFMGDAGTLSLGFFLGATSLYCSTHLGGLMGLGIVGLALGVALLDMFFSVLRRALERRSIFAPDRGHIHHRLLDLGLSQLQVVAIMHAVTLLAAGLGLLMLPASEPARFGILLCVIALLVVIFRRVGAVRLKDAVKALRHNWAIGRAIDVNRRTFEDGQLRLRAAGNFRQWWNAVCASADAAGFCRLNMTVESRDHVNRSLLWQADEHRYSGEMTLRLAVPVRHRRPGDSLWLGMEIPVEDSLESAGHKAALFVRLLEEHSLAELTEANEDLLIHAAEETIAA